MCLHLYLKGRAVVVGLITATTWTFLCGVGIGTASAGPIKTGVVGWGGVGIGGVPIQADATNLVAIAAKGQWIGLKNDGTIPGVPQAGSNVTAIASGYTHSLAVSNGFVFGWGDAGSGETTAPPELNGAVTVAVAAGVEDSLALTGDGRVIGWGYNGYDQVSVPAGLSNVVAISAGYYHNLALKNDGTVTAWGYNAEGETNVPPGLSGVIAVAGGYYHSLALKVDGTIVGWGSNASGQRQIPSGLSNVVAIAAGADYSLALKMDGTVVAWGDNSWGQTNVPAALSNVVAIAGAYAYAVALTNDGSPWLIRQPVDQIVYPGSTASFSAVVLGQPPLSYQWRSNGVDLAGATNLVLTLANVQPNWAGNYQLAISNAAGVAITTNAALTVLPPPLVSIDPPDLTTNGGANVTFVATVTGQGAGTFAYQWQFDGTNIAGATNTTLALTNLLVTQSGQYRLVLSNASGTVISSPSTLRVIPWVAVSIQPSTMIAGSGAYALFTLTSGGFSPTNTTYQWRKDGLSLGSFWLWTSTSPGAYVGASMANSGAYDVVATDPYVSATSAVATLTIVPLVINTQPTNRGAWVGGTARFTVSATGEAPLNYQWRFNGGSIGGATNTSLLLTNVLASQFGLYDVVISNAYTNITSSAATLSLSEVAVWGGSNGETNLTVGLTNLMAISASDEATQPSCLALTHDGNAISWPSSLSTAPPFYTAGSTNLIAIVGASPGFGLRSNGLVTQFPAAAPGVLIGLSNVVAIAANSYSLAVLKSNGTVVVPSGAGGNTVPPGLSNVVAIAVGAGHMLALKLDGTVTAWGNNNSGQATVPGGLSNVVAIAAGGNHSLALLGRGTVVGWGLNGNGQITIPSGLSNVVAIAAGYAHSLALRSDGTVVAWGLNQLGQTNVPARLTNAVAIAAGQYFSVAMIGTGPPVLGAQLSQPTVGAGGTFRVSLPTQSGRVYVLEYRDELSDRSNSNWTVLPAVPGNGTNVLLLDPSATSAAQRFYRVLRW